MTRSRHPFRDGLLGEWRIDNNPGYWGSSAPEILVLGFSKGTNQRSTLPFDRIAFNGARENLREILTALRFAAPELPAVSLDTVLFREAGGQAAWTVMERR